MDKLLDLNIINNIEIKTEYDEIHKVWSAYFSLENTRKHFLLDNLLANGKTELEAITKLKNNINYKMNFYTEIHNAISRY
jgi:orotate phosphoribosyltransferase-like protein